MDFLLGSLTAGTGGDGMNLGTIENMEVRIIIIFIDKTREVTHQYSLHVSDSFLRLKTFPTIQLPPSMDDMPFMRPLCYTRHMVKFVEIRRSI